MKSLILPLLPLLTLASPVSAAETLTPAAMPAAVPASAPKLEVGDKVTPEAFAGLVWIRGEAPKTWEPGVVYMFECWATWCGPCIANIPHVNELHQKYAGKGLKVYGIDVWEEGRAKPGDDIVGKVTAFVKKKGDGMSYPVAHAAKGSLFESAWLKAGGVSGIPHAFLVKDGVLILKSHPARISAGLIEGFIAGGDAQKKAMADLAAADRKGGEVAKLMQSFSRSLQTGKLDEAEKLLAQIREASPNEARLASFELDLAIERKEWDKAGKLLAALPDSMYTAMFLQSAASHTASAGESPKAFTAAVVEKFAPIAEKLGGPVDLQTLMKLRWRLDDKAGAIAAARLAVAKTKEEPYVKVGFSSEPYEKILASLEAGTLPDDATQRAWFIAAAKARSETRKAATNAAK